MRIHTVPTWPGEQGWWSSSRIRICEIGQGAPTVPGFFCHCSGVASVPPPSDAA
jgi:hypothetical protein